MFPHSLGYRLNDNGFKIEHAKDQDYKNQSNRLHDHVVVNRPYDPSYLRSIISKFLGPGICSTFLTFILRMQFGLRRFPLSRFLLKTLSVNKSAMKSLKKKICRSKSTLNCRCRRLCIKLYKNNT